MRYTVRECVYGKMYYYYDIEADSKKQAMEIYESTYPTNYDSEFNPDDNRFDNHTEVIDE